LESFKIKTEFNSWKN